MSYILEKLYTCTYNYNHDFHVNDWKITKRCAGLVQSEVVHNIKIYNFDDISVQLTLLSISLAIGSVYLEISYIVIVVHDECDAVFRSIFRFSVIDAATLDVNVVVVFSIMFDAHFFDSIENSFVFRLELVSNLDSVVCCDIGSIHRFFWFRLILFGLVLFRFYFWSFFILLCQFCFFVQIRICSSDVKVFAVFVPFEIFGSPLIYILKGVLSETITFYLLFVCQI